MWRLGTFWNIYDLMIGLGVGDTDSSGMIKIPQGYNGYGYSSGWVGRNKDKASDIGTDNFQKLFVNIMYRYHHQISAASSDYIVDS